MSFGFGIGDFLAVVHVANDVRKRFHDAPGQLAAIRDETKNLSNVLRDLEDISNVTDLSIKQKSDLTDYSRSGITVLKELNSIVDNYHELERDGIGFRAKSKRMWRKLKWEPEDIANIRARIASVINSLIAFYNSLNHAAVSEIKADVERLNIYHGDTERREFLDWLSPKDFEAEHSDIIRRHTEGTGSWLLQSTEYEQWMEQASLTLFCPGMPGAGKTMMSAIIVENLITSFPNGSNAGIAYFYCNYNRPQDQTLEKILASLLKQLLAGRPIAIPTLQQSFARRGPAPSTAQSLEALRYLSGHFSRVYIVIDALDECTDIDGIRTSLLEELQGLKRDMKLNLLATSRFDINTRRVINADLEIEIRATDDDVRTYLEKTVVLKPHLYACIQRNPLLKLQDRIQNEIVGAVEGMFLLAGLHLDSLRDKTTPKKLERALQNLPSKSKSSNVYADTYQQALARIDNQDDDLKQLARKVIYWLALAQRELEIEELLHALAVEIGEFNLDENSLEDPETLISVCAGLVTIDPDSNIIRLVHYTTREYFKHACMLWNPFPPAEIANVCLTYLSIDDTSTWMPTTASRSLVWPRLKYRLMLSKYPFLKYACYFWGTHVNMIAMHLVDQQTLLSFIQNTSKADCTNYVGAQDRYYSWDKSPRQVSGAHLATYFGASNVLLLLVKHGHSLDARDSHGRSALSWAAEHGQEDAAKLLLDNEVDADSKDAKGRTPLLWAAEFGHKAVVKLLLARDDVDADSRDSGHGRTPLLWAARYGHEAVTKLLLERDDVDVNSKDSSYGRTPLSLAAENGHEGVFKLLLERDDVDADSKGNNGRTPLSLAAENGREGVVKLLLERGDVEAESKDIHGRTPLFLAAKRGYELVVKLLLERDNFGADTRDDSYRRTPLS